MSVARAAFLAACLLPCVAFSQDVFVSPEEAGTDPDFAIQGEYAKDGSGVQVVAQGDGDFLIVIYRGGLPGAGWNGQDRQSIEGGVEDVTDLTEDYTKVARESSTLGATPPTDAVVLFDGTPESVADHWNAGARISDGLLVQGATSKEMFQDFRIHLEFRTPYQPLARGQKRGNSGLYYQGRYETQILDSFGLEGEDNETGGIYTIRKPDLNMCFPPLTWQTYDGEYRAARYEDGRKVANAVLTVRLNGVTIHSGVELPNRTTAAPLKEGPEPGPIYLQDHGNPVRYRNIWVQPMDADQEARRPLIAGFERFHASEQSASAEGGRILVGELNCLSCHAATAAVSGQVLAKTAPRLTAVGDRLRAEYVWNFLQNPHALKPGTTMPALLSHLPEEDRAEAASALTSFLSTTGTTTQQKPNQAWAREGKRLFHEVGCVACHLPQDGRSANPATSIPLTDLGLKYSIAGLTGFLMDPHAVRPSGRMPSFDLTDRQARDLAHFLAGNFRIEHEQPGVRYSVFTEDLTAVSDSAELTPEAIGTCVGLDLNVAHREKPCSLRLESQLQISDSGHFTFFLTSGVSSVLYIDGDKVVSVDGGDSQPAKSAQTKLKAGLHEIVIDSSGVSGDKSLKLEISERGANRQPIDGWLTLNEDGRLPEVVVASAEDQNASGNTFGFRADLVAKGAAMFASLGCASCHELKQGEAPVESLLSAPAFADCDSDKGCLADASVASVPRYNLNSQQRSGIVAMMSSQTVRRTAEQSIQHTMKVFNCYACHNRANLGGPEPDRHAMFVSQIPEMGDEGRVPPPLTGVGDKLKLSWLDHVLANGAKDRPYMLTRMPKFGAAAKGISKAFVEADRQEAGALPVVRGARHRMLTNGRKLVGSEGLSCVKCHTFGKFKASGIQALDLKTMANRINEDWFHKYLPKPEALRPGTRMPTAFPNGKSVVQEIYHGDPGQQTAAIWQYLMEGEQAKVPVGVMGGMIELKPVDRPVLYRNFITGLSPRGIAVGYPEAANLAWDANKMSLALIWHGRFIDSSLHWQGRGKGTQHPLGEHALMFESTAAVAALESRDTVWPELSPRDNGYRFLGYRLDAAGRPLFRYATEHFEVQDLPLPIEAEPDAALERHIRISAHTPIQVYFRAAVGTEIVLAEGGWYVVDDAARIRVRSNDDAFVRSSGGRMELLVPVSLSDGHADIIQDIAW